MTDNDISVSRAADMIYGERSDRTTRAVQRLIKAKVFPGARQLDPTIRNSPYLIPRDEVEAYIAQNKKLASASGETEAS